MISNWNQLLFFPLKGELLGLNWSSDDDDYSYFNPSDQGNYHFTAEILLLNYSGHSELYNR